MVWPFLIVMAILITIVLLRSLGRSSASNEASSPTEAWVMRQGKVVRTDKAFDASNSGDLREMLAALDTPTNPIDRHFLLLSITGLTYRDRKDPGRRAVFLKIATQHLQEFPSFVGPLKEDFDDELPRVPTFQQLATVLAEDGLYDEAVAVCEQAVGFDLHDNTQSGFPGRIKRIRRKQEKAKRQ